VAGAALEDTVLQPGQPWGRRLGKGERLRIVDLEGKQAVDFLCYDAADPSDRYNAANTIKLNARLFVEKGSILVSEQAKTLFTVTEDSCGSHDTIGGCCSAPMNLLRYNKPGPHNCRDTFIAALKPFGLDARDVVANVNFFMYVPVKPDGHTAITEGGSRPGDFVELRAERDVIAVISNCAQIYNPCNGFNPTPIRIVVTK
jgi:urea carboxylase-associated protein 1